MKRSRHFSLALALVPAALSAQIARDTARTAPIVITATRSPLTAGRSPASVSVITGDQLRQQGITTVLDALRQVPGVSVVQTGSFGGATSLFMRGGESKFVKVLVDGVPVNDAGGAFDFSTLSTDNIDRIEVVRGPASVLYGSDAMAGVVQLFTRAGDGRPHIESSARGGGFGSYDADASVRGAGDDVNYSLSGARHSTDGIQAFNSRYAQSVGSALVGTHRNGFDGRLSLRYSDNEFHYPTDGSGQVVDSNAVRKDGRLSVGIDAGYRLAPATEVRFALSSYDIHAATDDQADSKGDVGGYYFSTSDRSRRRSGELRLNVDARSDLHLSLGAQVERQWQNSSTQSNYGPSAFTANRRTSGVFAQALYSPIDMYTLTAGGRFEHNETFGDYFTYRAAASASLESDTRIRASVGTAFREPTFLENFDGAFSIGNPNLAPEHALSFDVGLEQELASVATVGATFFANSFRDLIDYKYSATAPNYFNLARTKTSGIELEARTLPRSGVTADAAVTYLDTKVIDPGTSKAVTAAFAPGAHLLRRPMHTIDAGVGYHGARGSVDARAHHVGPREDNYYAPDFSVKHVTLSPYTRADLSGEVVLPTDQRVKVTATLRVENVFDVRYTDVAGFNYDFARSDAASVAATGYRGAGRRVLAGLRLVF
ncbi:MAG: TonB-dependent receptor [Gemmatimonadota bacterium]